MEFECLFFVALHVCIWNMWNSLVWFVFCYVSHHILFYKGITCIYLAEYAEFSGMFYVFLKFSHVLHNFPEAKPDIARENHWQITIQKNIILQMEMSACRETPSWKKQNNCTEWETKASCGTLCLYISGVCGIFWNDLCFFCFCYV